MARFDLIHGSPGTIRAVDDECVDVAHQLHWKDQCRTVLLAGVPDDERSKVTMLPPAIDALLDVSEQVLLVSDIVHVNAVDTASSLTTYVIEVPAPGAFGTST